MLVRHNPTTQGQECLRIDVRCAYVRAYEQSGIPVVDGPEKFQGKVLI